MHGMDVPIACAVMFPSDQVLKLLHAHGVDMEAAD